MKKSLVITAVFVMICIGTKGSLEVKTVKYDNLLVKPDINSNESQNFYPFSTIGLVVNIIDINGTVINNEYCYGEPGTYTGLSQFYNPTGYELVGAIDNGVKLNKVQAENLMVPEFLGNSNETIDYIVKPVNKISKTESNKTKDDSRDNTKHKNVSSKPSNDPNVNSNTSDKNADKNNTNINSNNKIKNNKKVNSKVSKKTSVDTKNSTNTKTEKIDENKNIPLCSSGSINKDNNKLNSNSGKINNQKKENTQISIDLKKPEVKKVAKKFDDCRKQVNFNTDEKSKNYFVDNSKKVTQNNRKNIDEKKAYLSNVGAIQAKNYSGLCDSLKNKYNSIQTKIDDYDENIDNVFSFDVPVIDNKIIDNSKNEQKNSEVRKKSNFEISLKCIRNKCILIITALIGIISALSLAIKPKK